MQSSRTVPLFAELPLSSTRPSAFLISTVSHGLAFAVLVYGLHHIPRIDERSPDQQETVRLLNLNNTEPKLRWTGGGGASGGGSRHAIVQGAAPAASSGGEPSSPSVPQQLAQQVATPQTLVQPDLPPNVVLPNETPLPFVLMWSAENSPLKKVVPPPPQEITAADVRPSLLRPNRELDLADLKISATAFTTETPALPPSTTSPLRVRGPEPIKQVPETASKPVAPPTPARIMSLSDLHLEQGTIAVPMVNQTSPTPYSGALAPVRPRNTSETASSGTATNANGSGAGANPGSTNTRTGNTGGTHAAVGGAAGVNGPSGASPDGTTGGGGSQPGPANAGSGGNSAAAAGNNGAGASSAGQGNQESAAAGPPGGSGSQGGPSGSDAGLGLGSEPAADRITLPKDGKFGVVVVGSSLEQQYPETQGIWTDRLAYTVYLHVGAAKSWILQYSLPRAAEAAVAGNVTRPEAPWPYLIVRPHLSLADLNADAVMVHGFVNEAGHFEKLAIVFPPEFPQTKLLLSTLEKWEFRAAMQNQKMVTVEVLLVIPEDPE